MFRLTIGKAIKRWSVAADKVAGAKQLHIVFASPGAVTARKRTGSFPDGTVLVKEVYDTTTAPMTTGLVSHAIKPVGWFVMIRDSKNKHVGNKLWGDGWGWFDFDSPTRTTSTDYKIDCLGCHEPARKTGMIYEEGYSALR
jgi:Cytochrome P460